MRLEHWSSNDAIHFERMKPVFTHNQTWEPQPVFGDGFWHIYHNQYDHGLATRDGAIYHLKSTVQGIKGINGPYAGDEENSVLDDPRPPGSLDSLSVYQLENGTWLGLSQKGDSDISGVSYGLMLVRPKDNNLNLKWEIIEEIALVRGLPDLHGNGHWAHVENAVVNRVPCQSGGFMALVDLEGQNEVSNLEKTGFGVFYSPDGVIWETNLTSQNIIPVPGGVRTPLGFAELADPEFSEVIQKGQSLSLTLGYTYPQDHRSFYPYPPSRNGLFEGIFTAEFEITCV